VSLSTSDHTAEELAHAAVLAAFALIRPQAPVVMPQELCADCDRLAVVRLVVRGAEYGFCASHGLPLLPQ
jgi:hypothetical protein